MIPVNYIVLTYKKPDFQCSKHIFEEYCSQSFVFLFCFLIVLLVVSSSSCNSFVQCLHLSSLLQTTAPDLYHCFLHSTSIFHICCVIFLLYFLCVLPTFVQSAPYNANCFRQLLPPGGWPLAKKRNLNTVPYWLNFPASQPNSCKTIPVGRKNFYTKRAFQHRVWRPCSSGMMFVLSGISCASCRSRKGELGVEQDSWASRGGVWVQYRIPVLAAAPRRLAFGQKRNLNTVPYWLNFPASLTNTCKTILVGRKTSIQKGPSYMEDGARPILPKFTT